MKIYRILFLVAALAIIASACSRSMPPRDRRDLPKVSATTTTPGPIPPWQLWSSAPGAGPAVFEQAEAALARGDIASAERIYRNQLSSELSPTALREGVIRLVGTLLRQGKSKEALDEIAKFMRSQGGGAQDADALLSLLASYAYLHQKDLDQTLAWLGAAHKRSMGQGSVALRSSEEAERIVRSLPAGVFETFTQRWSADPFVGRMFREEKLRRARGGAPVVAEVPNWYSPAIYGGGAVETLPPIATAPAGRLVPAIGETISVGVLLPMTGRFAEHAAKVKEGIELAAQQSGAAGRLLLHFADTQANPEVAEREYERLVNEQNVVFVLGPLLVETTERVAERAKMLGVPFLTFTKKSGIASLGSEVFRLGATAEDQAEELISYSVEQLQLKSFAVLYPQTSAGEELALAFRGSAAKRLVEIAEDVSYVPGDAASIQAAVDRVIARAPQAIFLPDSIESVAPILDRLENSPIKDSVLLGPAQWNDPVAVRGYGQLLEGAIYVTPYYGRSAVRPVPEFVNQFRERFKHEPELLAAQGYDAGTFVFRALLKPGSAGQGVISTVVAADTLIGVTGKLQMDADGELHRRMSVLRLQAGEIHEVMAAGMQTGVTVDEQTQDAQKQESSS